MKINKLSESMRPSQETLDDCLQDYLNNAFGYDGVEDYVDTQYPMHSQEFKAEVVNYIKERKNESLSESKKLKEGITNTEPVVKFQGKSSHTFTKDKKWEVDFDETGNILARTRHGKPSYFKGHIDDKVNDFPSTDEDNIILAAREQHGLKFGKKNEGWSHFEFTSGANPYIAKTKDEAERIKRSRGDSVRYVGSINGIDYYKVDDGEEKDLFSVDEAFKPSNSGIQSVKVYNPYNYTIQELRVDNDNKTFERGNFTAGKADKKVKNRQEYEDIVDTLKELGYTEIKSDYRSLRNKTRKGIPTNESMLKENDKELSLEKAKKNAIAAAKRDGYNQVIYKDADDSYTITRDYPNNGVEKSSIVGKVELAYKNGVQNAEYKAVNESTLPRNASKIRATYKGNKDYYTGESSMVMTKDGGYWRSSETGTGYDTGFLRRSYDIEVLETDPNYKPNRTKPEYVVQGNYGYGWEDLTASDNPAEAKADLKAYRENEIGVPHRLVTRRVPVNEDIDYSKFRDLPDLIPIEVVPDNRKWQYSIGGVDVPYTSYEDAKAHMKDDYKITDYRDELQKYIDKETGRPHTFFVDETFDGRLVIGINWGDWKHEHGYADYLVKKFFMDKGLGIEVEEEVTEENGSDAYSADHYYDINDISFSGRVIDESKESEESELITQYINNGEFDKLEKVHNGTNVVWRLKDNNLKESIEVETIGDYITDHYDFDDIEDKYSCIDSIKDSFKNEKTISKEELEQFIGSHNGKDKVNESRYINEGWSGDTYKGYSILLNDDSINWDAEQVRLVWRILDKDGNKVGSVAGQANARKFVDDLLKNIDKQVEKKYLGARVEFSPYGNDHNHSLDIDWGDTDYLKYADMKGTITFVQVDDYPDKYTEDEQIDACTCDVLLDNGEKLEAIRGYCLNVIKLKNESINESKATHCVYFSLDGGKTQEIEFEGTEDECQDYIAKQEADNEFGDEAPERFVKRLSESSEGFQKEFYNGYVILKNRAGDGWDIYSYDGTPEKVKKAYLEDEGYATLKDAKAEIDRLNKESNSMNEASYGGAFDIEDDQYFTREDLENAAEEVLNHINETFEESYNLGGTWFEDGKWIVNVQDDGFNEYEVSVPVDMRKIREPWHLRRAYAGDVAAKLIAQIKEYNGLDEDTTVSSTFEFDDDTDDLTYYHEDEEFRRMLDEEPYIEIASKQVPDSDGFLTDYTMYKNINTGEYVFVFGDKDIYRPEDGYFDWECETEEEAKEWFDNYVGFDDDLIDECWSSKLEEEAETSPIVHKKSDGSYLIQSDSGDGYTAFSKDDVCQGHISASNDVEAKNKFNSNKFDE
jgi:hypothetical protein